MKQGHIQAIFGGKAFRFSKGLRGV